MTHTPTGFARAAVRAAILLGTSLTLSTQALATLEIGAAAPDFKLKSAMAGNVGEFTLTDALKQGPVVLYFFPAAFTSGCNREAHAFAEKIPAFKALGATVIGVSNDKIDTIAKFSVQECAGKFSVAADPDSEVIKSYDAKFPVVGTAKRVSYVIGQDGKVHYVYSALSPDGHIENTLKALKDLPPATVR